MKNFFRAAIAAIVSFFLFHLLYTLFTFLLALLAVPFPFIGSIVAWLHSKNSLCHIVPVLLSACSSIPNGMLARRMLRNCTIRTKHLTALIVCASVAISVLFFYSSDIVQRIAVCTSSSVIFYLLSNDK